MKFLENRFVTFFSSLIIFTFIIYACMWAFVAFTLKHKTEWAIDVAQQKGIILQISDMALSGFPNFPCLTLTGQVFFENGLNIATQGFSVCGLPFPSATLKIKINEGAVITTHLWPTSIDIEKAFLSFDLPPFSFLNATPQEIKNWQQTGGSIPVHKLHVVSNVMTMDGQGFVSLDQDYQPTGQIMMTITGLGNFIEQMVAHQKIDARQAIMAQSLLQLVSRKDEKTGETYVATSLRVQKNAAYLGPLRFYTIPVLEWGW